jgi:hypothetical protein
MNRRTQMGRSKSPKKIRRVTIRMDDMVHSAIDGVFIVGDLFLGTGYTSEKANQKISEYCGDDLLKRLMLTEFVNSCVRIINTVQATQKELVEGNVDAKPDNT